jgi:hypothetical protein
VAKKSRDKGARSERQLRDELRSQGWQDVVRVPLSGAVKSKAEYQDDVVGTAPDGKLYRFENKARKAGFDKIYGMLGHNPRASRPFTLDGACYSVSLNIEVALSDTTFFPIEEFAPADQKVLRSIAKKCADWIGNADILSLKQDRMPFIYIRCRR